MGYQCVHGCMAGWFCGLCDHNVVAPVPPDNGAAATRMTGVPREPTEAMINAGYAVFGEADNESPMRNAWRAMWDAYHAPNR